MNKEILKLAIPNILTNLTVPLVSMVDLGLMGRMPSSSYIIAIGFGTIIFNFVYWAFGFLRMGTTGMVSQAFGRKDEVEGIDLLRKGLIISFVGGVLLFILQIPIQKLALFLIDPDVSVVEPLISYFKIRIYAAPATISLFVITGWLLGMQDSKSALLLAILINSLNAVLSYFFVNYTALSISGVALGTVIAQYMGFFIGLVILQVKHQIRLLCLFKSVQSKKSWNSFLSVNSDIFIRTLCLIFVMSYFKTEAGNIDPILGAANILLFEFITISAYGIDGFAFAAESISGKYFGQGEMKTFKKSVKISMLWGISIALFLALQFSFFGKSLLSMLTNKEQIILAAMNYLPWLIAAPIVNAFAFIWDGIYVGTTSSKAMRNTMLISTFAVFLPLFYLARTYLGNHGMWLAFTLFMFARGLLQTILANQYIFNRLKPND